MKVLAIHVPMEKSYTQSNVSVSTTDGEISAAKSRKALVLQNTGANDIYITLDGDTATSTSGFKLAPGAGLSFESGVVPNGQIRGIAMTAASNLVIAEAV